VVDETQQTGGSGAGPTGAGPTGTGPVVEDNGPWWLVFILTFGFLLAAACAFLFHSLAVTFG
jgi:hypothetical protein